MVPPHSGHSAKVPSGERAQVAAAGYWAGRERDWLSTPLMVRSRTRRRGDPPPERVHPDMRWARQPLGVHPSAMGKP